MTTTSTRPKATAKFKALVVALNSEEQAIVAWNRAFPTNPIGEAPVEVPAEVATLIAAGFTDAEARQILADGAAAPTPEPTPPTSRELGEALVETQGLTFTKGRVYTTTPIIEAQIRVLETGEPEVVATDGSRRTTGVLVFRMDDGTSVAVQNLTTPKKETA